MNQEKMMSVAVSSVSCLRGRAGGEALIAWG